MVILGLGLIGGSLAKTLVRAHWRVRGWDPDPDVRSAARECGIEIAESVDSACGEPGALIVVAAPLREMGELFAQIAACTDDTTTVCDVGSVKAPVRGLARQAGLGARYVGAHPMAGTERSGFAATSPQLLRGVVWAITIDDDTASGSFRRVVELVTDGTNSRALVLDDAVHDAAVAKISHVPHALAAGLLTLATGGSDPSVARALAAGSFRDGTRVARGDWRRSQAMVEANGEAVAICLLEVAARLQRLAADLADGRDTAWFFHAPPGEQARPGGPGARSIAAGPAWARELRAAGRTGEAVVGIDADGYVLEPLAKEAGGARP
nr:prephenate dehydrogenase/arogenate dehydrogenase family protein [Rarobacter incanus]